MKRLLSTALLMLIVSLAAASRAAAQTPEEQYAFADRLATDGDNGFALLEYKRFVFHNGKHAKATDGAFAVARLYISYVGDVDRAKATLTQFATDRKDAAIDAKVKSYIAFIDSNNDLEGKPLKLYVSAEAAEARGDNAGAAEDYESLVRDYDRAKLADDALLRLARVHLEKLNDPRRAMDLFVALGRAYPVSEHRANGELGYAQSLEKINGNIPTTVAAYQHVVNAYPKTDEAKVAQERIAFLAKQPAPTVAAATPAKPGMPMPPAPKDPKKAAEYKVVREGYAPDNDAEFVVLIEFDPNLDEDATQATLDAALTKRAGERAKAEHGVLVEGYYNYPLSKAGYVRWKPNTAPQFALKKRKSGDKLRDSLLDLFKDK